MIDVRRAGDRPTTPGDGTTTRHSFSFGSHYDPANVGFSVLVAHNDDRVEPGRGYDTHPHADLEIVTWVLEGALLHTDSRGHTGELAPGVVQRLGAGSGVLHSEHASRHASGGATRFVQMWLRPDEPGAEPSFDRAPAPTGPGLVPLLSGVRGLDAAAGLAVAGAALHVARLAAGDAVALPDAARLHVFVATGSAALEGAGTLGEGDAARVSGAGSRRLTGLADAEVLVWQLP